MIPSKSKKHAKSEKDSQANWAWWQLDVANKFNPLKGRDRVALSRHIVNLRTASLSAPTVADKNLKVKNSVVRSNINFIKLVKPELYSLSNWFEAYIKSWPLVRDLSIVFILDIIFTTIDVFWLVGFIFFIKISEEVNLLSKSIFGDIKVYISLVHKILVWPFSKFIRSSGSDYAPLVNTSHSFKPKTQSTLIQAGIFLILVLSVVLPVKSIALWQNIHSQGSSVVNLTKSGFVGLEQASSLLLQGNAVLAQEELAKASMAFSEAQVVVNSLDNNLISLLDYLPIVGGKVEAAKLILAASKEIALAEQIVAKTLADLNEINEDNPFNLAVTLSLLSDSITNLKPHFEKAINYLQLVNKNDLPGEYKTKLLAAQEQLISLNTKSNSFFVLPQLLSQLLNNPEPKTYVVIFQNSNELRPTGGFMGSLALISAESDEIKSINIPGGGPYDYQGSLERVIRPPEPLRLVRGTWQLQDANWFYDFPSSAEKVMWFLSEAGGPETDGLISLNSEVVVELLKITGPIELPQYDKVLTADNFIRETQAAVEIEYDRQENRPKEFIADLAPILFNRLISLKGNELISLTTLINSSLLNKSLQLYSRDFELQNKFEQFGWAGQVATTPADYLAIVRTNIGGGKTDGVIREQIKHRVEISPLGDIIVNLSLKRSHEGDPLDTFESRRNVSYLRFYVPSGSTLLATQGFTPPPSNYYLEVPDSAEIDADLTRYEESTAIDSASGTVMTSEFGKTVFANWLSLLPGESKTVEIRYRLPWRLTAAATWQDLRRYSLFLQRQSGVRPIDFSSEITWPENFQLRWQESSRQPLISNGKMEMKSDWQRDDYYGIILEKN